MVPAPGGEGEDAYGPGGWAAMQTWLRGWIPDYSANSSYPVLVRRFYIPSEAAGLLIKAWAAARGEVG